jgi:hypothetical protein
MKKSILLLLILIGGLSINAQELQISKPIKKFYTSMTKDFEVMTTSSGDRVVIRFKDHRYTHITEYEYIYFKDKAAMLHFFKKVEEVQMSPKTEKSVNVTLIMTDYVVGAGTKTVMIVRPGSRQFLTTIYSGSAYFWLPKTRLVKVLKKIRK